MRNEQVGEKRHSLLNILYEQQGENGMKLRIIDEFWAVGKKTRRVGKMLKPLCAGRIEGQHGCFGCCPTFGRIRRMLHTTEPTERLSGNGI